jgi:acetylornithine deacetylase/succinyl-diaminopimelate desuccinylase-like protein
MKNLEALLLKLISIKSFSKEEKEIGEFIFNKLAGFGIKKQVVDKKLGRFNLFVNGNKKINLWFVAHIDTVKGFPVIKETKDKIFGRGSMDNKTSVACLISLIEDWKGKINVFFTVGEEDDFIGAKFSTKIIPKDSKVIVLEGTEFNKIGSQRGVITIKVEATGVAEHSSRATKENCGAIIKLMDFIFKLRDKDFSAFNVGTIIGGTAENIIAGEAKAEIAIRPKDNTEFDEVISWVKDLGKKMGVATTIKNRIKPFVSALSEEATGEILCFTEMAFFKNSFLFGAGNINVAHTEKEFIKKSDLHRLKKELNLILEKEDK